MKFTHVGSLCLGMAMLFAAPALAQEHREGMESMHAVEHAPEAEAFLADMTEAVEVAADKLQQLAAAIPQEHWDWRPGEGVRSVGEVFLHVVADNYFFPAAMGMSVPGWTGINGQDYSVTQAFEQRDVPRAQAIEELTDSFSFVVESMKNADATAVAEEMNLFGRTYTQREFWVLMTTHVHEHLGQMIAYARTNGVKPPWSM